MSNFLLYGPLLQFDIAERGFTCIFDVFWLLGFVTDVDVSVFFIISAFFSFQVSDYYASQLLYSSLLNYNVENMVKDLVSEKNYNVVDIMSMLFISVFLANFVGLVPYSQTITSQLLLTLSISILMMLGIWFQGFVFTKIFFFSHFLPAGSPLVIIPFIILIELVSNVSRIVSLAVRLFANMTSGHALLKILSGFAIAAGSILLVWKFLIFVPVLIIVIITALEMLIAFLQTYVLVTLLLIYSSEQE